MSTTGSAAGPGRRFLVVFERTPDDTGGPIGSRDTIRVAVGGGGTGSPHSCANTGDAAVSTARAKNVTIARKVMRAILTDRD